MAALLASRQAAAQPLFDPRSDYLYDLDEMTGEHVSVEVDESGFLWPGGRGETALLELRLRKSRGQEPAIRMRGPGGEAVQFFEKGAQGVRLLDLSRVVDNTGPGSDGAAVRIGLVSEGATWQTGATRLHLFSNPEVRARRLLVVAPHPDDAEIAAFGVYLSGDSDVVTVTAGDAGGWNFDSLVSEEGEHYRLKGWVRTWDSIMVPYFGGVAPGRARNLGFYDATLGALWERRPDAVQPPLAKIDSPEYYRLLNVDPVLKARPFSSTWEGLVGDLLSELERVEPLTVVAPHPLLDRHRDHQFATIALIEAVERWSGECELYLYTNHAVNNEAFPLGPRAGMTGLPPWSGGDLFVERIYSHQLSSGEANLKLLALEAMHDLRPFDPRDGTVEKANRKEVLEARRFDYFRRGPRPNELFFVLDEEGAGRLREAFLERLAR